MESDGGDPAPAAPARAFGLRAHAEVQRAIAEFLAGRPVIATDAACEPRLVLPVDALSLLDELRWSATGPLALVVSGRRAEALGAHGLRAATLRLPAFATEARVLELACAAGVSDAGPFERGDRVAEAAVELAKLAAFPPRLRGRSRTVRRSTACCVWTRPTCFRTGRHACSLRRVSSAPMPLRAAPDCELTGLPRRVRTELVDDPRRPARHACHRTGAPALGLPDRRRVRGAAVRLRRAAADGAVARLAETGGVLLYLAQEGRGTGLANKMRAYRLQEEGLDTMQANTTLGFEVDERRYEIAARMLQMAGIERVALLTNNPSKLAALVAAGIDVRERIPLLAPVRGGNRRYLETKRSRAGHLIGDAPAAAASWRWPTCPCWIRPPGTGTALDDRGAGDPRWCRAASSSCRCLPDWCRTRPSCCTVRRGCCCSRSRC